MSVLVNVSFWVNLLFPSSVLFFYPSFSFCQLFTLFLLTLMFLFFFYAVSPPLWVTVKGKLWYFYVCELTTSKTTQFAQLRSSFNESLCDITLNIALAYIFHIDNATNPVKGNIVSKC